MKPQDSNLWPFLRGGGEMSQLINEYDWTSTPLGPIQNWPPTLKISLNLLLNSRHPMFIAWGDKQIFLYNDAYIHVLSLSKHPSALGKPFAEVWTEIWDICGPLTEKVFKNAEASFIDNLRLFMRRGSYLEETYYSFSYNPIRDEEGVVIGLFCACVENTGILVNQRRLKTLSELSAKALIEKTTEAACASAMNILAKNPDDIPFALLYLVDDQRSELTLAQAIGIQEGIPQISLNSFSLLENHTQQSVWPLREVFTSKKTQLFSVTEVNGLPLGLLGQPITEVIILSLNYHQEVEATGLLIVGVNACRKLEAECQAFYELVARHVATAMQNARTYEEEKKRAEALTELDRAKSNFFSNVSHEFRTPLTLISGMLQDLFKSQENFSPQQKEALALIQSNTNRLLKLVNSILDFSRIEAGKMQGRYAASDLTQLTADVASMFRSTIEKGGIEFIVNMPQIMTPVYIDNTMWEKIVLNLLSNAFKFTHTGKIEISLQYFSQHAELQVKDTGCGIPPAEVERIFERFHRVEKTEGRSHEGTGIGLALVRELVKLHGGSVEVSSELGKGSLFTVSIPLGRAHLPVEEVEEQSNVEQTLKSTNRAKLFIEEAQRWLPEEFSDLAEKPLAVLSKNSGLKPFIIVAEDNKDMRFYLGKLLRPHYDVSIVANGEEALQVAKQRQPALLISDIMMPKMDGLQLLQAVRNDATLQTVPVSLLSARAGDEASANALAAGADDYMLKPFIQEDLLARIKIQVDKSTQRLERERQLFLETARREAAENYKKLQEEFINTICHEIRNPLNGMYGSIGLLEELQVKMDIMFNSSQFSKNEVYNKQWEMHNKEWQELNAAMKACAEQQKMIVDDVLDLSKLENNKIILNSMPFNPHESLTSILQMFNAQAAQKNIKLNYISSSSSSSLWAKGDPTRLGQILINLLSNAIKFTKIDGVVEIALHITEIDDQTWHLTFTVTDNGIGMTPEECRKLFLPFAQANAQISKAYGGTGLGLAICKKLVEAMSGNITAKSEKDKGSIFEFSINCEKLSPEERKKLGPPRPTLLENPVSVNSGPAKNILIVEDNLINRNLLTKQLQKQGHFCQSAENGEIAINLYIKSNFDVIFMDIEMPVMGGLEATRILRQWEKENKRESVLIIGISGNARPEQQQAGIEAGMDAYIFKPYHAEDIKRIIAKHRPGLQINIA